MFVYFLKIREKPSQSGNVFFALFAAVAVLGLVGTVYTTTIKGPAKGVSNITKGTSSETDIFAAANFAVKSSIQDQTSGSDCDADSYIELLPWRAATAGVPAPVGGGLLPANLPTRKTDSWGTQIGYCTWDHGPKTTTDNVTGPAGCPGSSALRLKGTNAKTQTLIAVISAGPDKIFATKCNAWADANSDGTPDVPLAQKTAGADDIVVSFTYAEAIDANKGATTNGLESMPDSACTPDKVGIMRYEMEVAQVCQADGWHEIGANADGAEQFATTFDAELNSTTNKSNEITFSGFFGPRPITVDNGATILVNDQPKGSSTTIVAGDRVSLMATAASTPQTPRSFTLKVSSLDRIWTLRTRDKTPANLTISPANSANMNVDGISGLATGTPVLFTVTNTGEADAVMNAISSSNPTNFNAAFNDQCQGKTLSSMTPLSKTCTVTIQPQATATGGMSATLSASAPDATSGTATLTGDALFPITLASPANVNVNIQTLPEFSGGYVTTRWTANRPKFVIVPTGVVIGSANPSLPALQTGTGWGGTLSVTVNGEIQGAGGAVNGGVGGTAFSAGQSGTSLINNGAIRAGGGGGGKGGDGSSSVPTTVTEGPLYNIYNPYYYVTNNGYWLWGGQQVARQYNVSTISVGGYIYYKGGYAGAGANYYISRTHTTYTTTTSPGGAGGRGQGYDVLVTGISGATAGGAGSGGTGGTWGAAGTGGSIGTTAGTAGGDAGWAIQNYGNVSYSGSGVRQGRY